MWALVKSNKVTEVYTRPKAITIGDINYPQNIFTLWTEAELKAVGIYSVIIDNSKKKDPEYYINTSQSFAYSTSKKTVTASYGTATARDLDDKTVSGVVTRGLKYNHKEIITNQAYGLLQPNDWLVVRNQEAGTAIPSDWTTFRTGVRTSAESMKGKIDSAANVDALAALYVYDDSDPPVRPLGEFPTPPE